MLPQTKRRLSLEQLFFAISLGIESEKDINYFLEICNNFKYSSNYYLPKIKSFFNQKYKTELKEKYQTKYDSNIINSLDSMFLNPKNKSLYRSQMVIEPKSTHNLETEELHLNEKRELFISQLPVQATKLKEKNESTKNLLDAILDINNVNKKQYINTVIKEIREQLNAFSNIPINLLFHLFIIKQFQQKENLNESLHNIIFQAIYGENQASIIIKHLKKLANILLREDFFTKFEFIIPQNQNKDIHLIYYMNLINFINSSVNVDTIEKELLKLAILEKSCDIYNKYICTAVETILKYLDKYEDVLCINTVFKCLLFKTKWYKNINCEIMTKKEQTKVIIWVIEKMEKNHKDLSSHNEEIKKRMSEIINVLVNEKQYDLITYCLLYVAKHYVESKEILTQYNKIIPLLPLKSINEFSMKDEFLFSLFALRIITEEFSQSEKINKIKTLKLIEVNNKDLYIVNIILDWIKEHYRNEILKKNPVNFRKDFEKPKRSSSTISKNRIIDYIPSLELNGVLKRIYITNNSFKKANKVTEFKNFLIKNAKKAQIILCECKLETKTLDVIKNIKVDNGNFELNGFVLKYNQIQCQVFLVSKYKKNYFSLTNLTWIESSSLRLNEKDKILLIYIRKATNSNILTFEGKFSLELKEKNEIYSQIISAIQKIIPNIKGYILTIQNGEQIDFEIIEKEDTSEQIIKECDHEEIEEEKHNFPRKLNKVTQNKNNNDDKSKISVQEFDILKLQEKMINKEKIEHLKNCIIQVKNSKVFNENNVKFIFYLLIFIYLKSNSSDKEIKNLLINESLGITQPSLNNLVKLIDLCKVNIKMDFIKLEYLLSQSEIDKNLNNVYYFLILILSFCNLMNNLKSSTSSMTNEMINIVKTLNLFVSPEIVNEYKQKFLNYIEQKNKIIFSECNEILTDSKYNKLIAFIKNPNIKQSDLKQWEMQLTNFLDKKIICPQIGLYIGLLIYYQNNMPKKLLKDILVNDNFDITDTIINNIEIVSNHSHFKIERNLEQIQQMIVTNHTNIKIYSFLLRILVLIDYIYKPQKVIDIQFLSDEILELTKISHSFDNQLCYGHLVKLMDFLNKRLVKPRNLKSFSNFNQIIINKFLENFQENDIKDFKEKYEIIKNIFSFILEHPVYVETFFQSNIENFHKILKILFFFEEEMIIADLLMYLLNYNINDIESINTLTGYKEIKNLLRKKYYEKNKLMDNNLKYAIIMFFSFPKMLKFRIKILQTRFMEFQTEDETNFLDVHLIFLYLNSHIRKHVFQNKSTLETKLVNIFESFKKSDKIKDSDALMKLKKSENSSKLVFINQLLQMENVIQIITNEELKVFSKTKDKLPSLVYVKYTPKTFKNNNPLNKETEIIINEEIHFELLGVVLLFKERKGVFDVNKNKYIYPIRDSLIYNKYDKKWFSLVNHKWQDNLTEDVLINQMKAINLIFSKKVKKHSKDELNISALNSIKSVKKHGISFNYFSTLEWLDKYGKSLEYSSIRFVS